MTVSVVSILASQIASPNTQGYCLQSQYNSNGIAERVNDKKIGVFLYTFFMIVCIEPFSEGENIHRFVLKHLKLCITPPSK